MKNPWMSAWLSAANSMTGAARGQMMASVNKAQRQAMQDWQDAWVSACMEMWFPKKGKR